MENKILAVAARRRLDHDTIRTHLTEKRWSREFGILLDFMTSYYNRDQTAEAVDPEILTELIKESTHAEKHKEKFVNLLTTVMNVDVSAENLVEVVLAGKRSEIAQALSIAIANGQPHQKLLEEYQGILSVTELESPDQAEELVVYTSDDIDELLAEAANRDNVVPIFPRALADRLDGGLEGSDHLILIARPEIGKTALILTIACGIARTGKKVVLFNNEERIARLYTRAISCMTGRTVQEVRADPQGARDLAMERGFGNLIFVEMTPGSPAQIDAELEKHPDAVAFIVDQLRHLLVKGDNRTNQLEAAANAVRNIAKRRDLVAISVTQAGDSAEGESILGMGDVDSSNTGIPGACDVLLGVGANEQQKRDGIRVMTLIKNKVSGAHESFHTRINSMISKYVSV